MTDRFPYDQDSYEDMDIETSSPLQDLAVIIFWGVLFVGSLWLMFVVLGGRLR